MSDKNNLLSALDKIHTTELGEQRIQRNLCLDSGAVAFCKGIISKEECKITKRGKNFYCEADGIVITVNSYSYTIITAHRKKHT